MKKSIVLGFLCLFFFACSSTPNISNKLETLVNTDTIENNYTAKDYFESGKAKFISGNFVGAIEYLSRAIELDQKYAEAYYYRGAAKLGLSDYTEAIKDCNKAIELNPKKALSYFARGTAKYGLTDYYGAIKDLNEALGFEQNAMFYIARGVAKTDLNNYDEAIEDFSEAIKLEPKNAVAYYYRGITKKKIFYYYTSVLEDLSTAGELGYSKAYEEIQNINKK